MDRGSAIWVPRIFVRLGAASGLNIAFANITGFTLVFPRYGDHRLGSAPMVVGVKNTAVATVDLVSLIGGGMDIPDTLIHMLPVNVHLIDVRVSPRNLQQNTLLVRPSADNVSIACGFEWELVRDQVETRGGTDVILSPPD